MRRQVVDYIGYSILTVFLFYLALFLLSLVFGFGGGENPGLVAMILFAVVMGCIVFWLLIRRRPVTREQAVAYAFVWTLVTFAITLFITIANGTTGVVFGAWYDYVVYFAMIAAPFFVRIQARDTNRKKDADV